MHTTGLPVDNSLSVSLLKAHKNNFTVLRGRLDRTLVPVPGTRYPHPQSPMTLIIYACGRSCSRGLIK